MDLYALEYEVYLLQRSYFQISELALSFWIDFGKIVLDDMHHHKLNILVYYLKIDLINNH